MDLQVQELMSLNENHMFFLGRREVFFVEEEKWLQKMKFQRDFFVVVERGTDAEWGPTSKSSLFEVKNEELGFRSHDFV